MDSIIETQGLTKYYGSHRGIVDVDLAVQKGEVFGFLGPNGAGKTTTIRLLLDLIRPTSGRATVFGIETTVDPSSIHRRIGYLPGEFALYDRLTGGQTIEYFANLRGAVDPLYQADLIARLDLDPSRRFREYSRGNKQKVGLVIALQHRPELLVLDEPTAGLDPLVQQSFFQLLRDTVSEGRTAFLSSHILGEVEKTCDRVAIIRDGRLVTVDRVEALRDLAHHQVELRFSQPVPAAEFVALPGVSDVVAEDHVLRMRVTGSMAPVVQAAARHDLVDFSSREPSLEDTFLAQYGREAVEVTTMAAEIGRGLVPATAPQVPALRRLHWLGSVFGKTLRDSRLGAVTMAGLLGAIVLGGGATMASTYGTLQARADLATLSSSLPPVLRGLYGDPVNVDTLGGFVSWHYGAYFALLTGLWSILALSSTLAGEARRGSLEFALVTPLSRRTVAFQKVAGHVVALSVAMAVVALIAWIVGVVSATLPGDAIAPSAAVGFAVGVGAKALIAGSVAFVIAPLLGRGAAAGLAGALLVAGYVLHSYRALVPAFDPVANLTWFSWMRDHLPLAGQTDWPSVAFVLVIAAALLAVGVEVFARRDVGVTSAIRTPGFPRALLGTRGPLDRTIGELLPASLAWGIGLGLYGFVMAASSSAFTAELMRTPDLVEMVRSILPGVDMTTTAGFLQMAFVDFGLVLAALAAATLVAGRSSDETSGRLELLITTPLTRIRWAVASGLGVWVALVVTIALLAASIGIGAGLAGDDGLQPMLGTFVVAAYGLAMAGIGLAVGGLTRSSYAGPAVLVVAIGTFLVDILGGALRLPDSFQQLALSSHMGQPMVGTWDGAGLLACAVLAVGGLLLGAWGMNRRDVSG